METSHEVVLSSLLKRMSNLQTSHSSKESILSPFHVQGILLINAFSALIPGLAFLFVLTLCLPAVLVKTVVVVSVLCWVD